MSAVLLANVGDRDVAVADRLSHPELAQGEARTWGKVAASKYERYAPLISLPILSKAIDYVLTKEGRLDGILLFVSDQPEGSTRPENREKDTLYLGQIIREHLASEVFGGEKKRTYLRTIKDNPADYHRAMTFFKEELPRAKGYCPPDTTFYLSLSGGTPAMNMMMMLVGVETFAENCVGLYVSEQHEHPFPLAAVRSLYARSLRDTLLAQIEFHSYSSALALFQENSWILDSDRDKELLQGFLGYARDRLAFDFSGALESLQPALAANHQLTRLADEVMEPGVNWKLRELYYNAEIRYRDAAYADFLARVLRFEEAIMQYLAEKHGAVVKDETKESLDRGWLESEPGLAEHLEKEGIEPSPANRDTLRAMLRYLAGLPGNEALEETLNKLVSIQKLGGLRNRAITAHGFEGISRDGLEEVFQADPDEILPTMRPILQDAIGEEVAPNPFDEINRRCRAILAQ